MAELLDETGPFMILEDYLHDCDDEDLEASFRNLSIDGKSQTSHSLNTISLKTLVY